MPPKPGNLNPDAKGGGQGFGLSSQRSISIANKAAGVGKAATKAYSKGSLAPAYSPSSNFKYSMSDKRMTYKEPLLHEYQLPSMKLDTRPPVSNEAPGFGTGLVFGLAGGAGIGKLIYDNTDKIGVTTKSVKLTPDNAAIKGIKKVAR